MDNVKGEDLLPFWQHIVRFLDYLRMIYLLIPVYLDLDHGFEAVGVEELVVELALNNVESEGATFHDRDAVDEVTRLSLLDLLQFHLHFFNLRVHHLNILRQELNIVLTIFKSLELHVDEFTDV